LYQSVLAVLWVASMVYIFCNPVPHIKQYKLELVIEIEIMLVTRHMSSIKDSTMITGYPDDAVVN
jgi:hypothetical protein